MLPTATVWDKLPWSESFGAVCWKIRDGIEVARAQPNFKLLTLFAGLPLHYLKNFLTMRYTRGYVVWAQLDMFQNENFGERKIVPMKLQPTIREEAVLVTGERYWNPWCKSMSTACHPHDSRNCGKAWTELCPDHLAPCRSHYWKICRGWSIRASRCVRDQLNVKLFSLLAG